MKKILDLVAPKLALVLDLLLVREILDHEDRHIGDLRAFDAELEEFFFGCMRPVKPDRFFQFFFQNFSLVDRAIPGEREYIIALVNFIRKPLLQPGGSA